MSTITFIKRVIKRLLRLNPVPVPQADHRQSLIPNDVLMPQVAQFLAEGHTVTLPLKGNSMRPFLCHLRDKALLVRPEKFDVSDPVLAEVSPGHYVLHRIVAIDGDRVTLRGDGNMATETCRRSDVIALAKAFYRKGRTTPDYISSSKWRLYSWIWMNILPIRPYLLLLHHAIFRSLKVLE